MSSYQALDANSFLPEGGMVSITEEGHPVVVFPGALDRSTAADRAYMALVSGLGMETTDERLRAFAIGPTDSPIHSMLLAPLYIRISRMWGTDMGDGFYLDYRYGEFELTAVNLEGLAVAEISDDGASIRLL